MNLLNEFKNFQVDRMDTDDLVALVAFGHQLRDQYEKFGLEVPDFVTDNLKTLTREIKMKTAQTLEARRKSLLAQKEALKTTAERKRDIETELKEVEAQLQTT